MSVSEPNDDERRLVLLVERALAGDEDARQELFGMLRDLAKRTATAKLRGKRIRSNDGSDVAHDSLLRLLEKLKALPVNCDAKVRAYLVTTVLNTIRTHARAANSESRAIQRLSLEAQKEVTRPSKRVHLKDSVNKARMTAITELSDEQRQALDLVLGENLSLDACAERMKRTKKAVEHLIERTTRAILASTTGIDTPTQPVSGGAVRRALIRYLQETEGGRSIDREAFLRRYPQQADELAPLLTELELVRQVIRGPAD